MQLQQNVITVQINICSSLQIEKTVFLISAVNWLTIPVFYLIPSTQTTESIWKASLQCTISVGFYTMGAKTKVVLFCIMYDLCHACHA